MGPLLFAALKLGQWRFCPKGPVNRTTPWAAPHATADQQALLAIIGGGHGRLSVALGALPYNGPMRILGEKVLWESIYMLCQ